MIDIVGTAPLLVEVALTSATGSFAVPPVGYAVDWGEPDSTVVDGERLFLSLLGNSVEVAFGARMPPDFSKVATSQAPRMRHIYEVPGTYHVVAWVGEGARPPGGGLSRTMYATEPAVGPTATVVEAQLHDGTNISLHAGYPYDGPFDPAIDVDSGDVAGGPIVLPQLASTDYPFMGEVDWAFGGWVDGGTRDSYLSEAVGYVWSWNWTHNGTSNPDVPALTGWVGGGSSDNPPPRPSFGDGDFPVAETRVVNVDVGDGTTVAAKMNLGAAHMGGKFSYPVVQGAVPIDVWVEFDYTGKRPYIGLFDQNYNGIAMQPYTMYADGLWDIVSDTGTHVVYKLRQTYTFPPGDGRNNPSAQDMIDSMRRVNAGFFDTMTGYTSYNYDTQLYEPDPAVITHSIKNVQIRRTVSYTPGAVVGDIDVRLNNTVELMSALPGDRGPELYWTVNGKTHRGATWHLQVFDNPGEATWMAPAVYPITVGLDAPGDLGIAFQLHVHRPRYAVATVTVKAPLGVPAPPFPNVNDLDGADALRSLVFE